MSSFLIAPAMVAVPLYSWSTILFGVPMLIAELIYFIYANINGSIDISTTVVYSILACLSIPLGWLSTIFLEIFLIPFFVIGAILTIGEIAVFGIAYYCLISSK